MRPPGRRRLHDSDDAQLLAQGVQHDAHASALPVTDVQAGITAGFVNFNGGLPDVHMFKIRNGKIEMIQAVFGGNAQGANWPDETK